MPKKSKKIASTTTVAYLLDRSGSMESCRDATIEAFNAYLSGLKGEPLGIEFTFLQFDTVSLDKVHVAEQIERVPSLSRETFVPRGMTPLIDAAYKTIKAVESSVKPNAKVIVCIQTDGQENSSTEHTMSDLKELITAKQALGWQFNFMGAGINAYASSAAMGISAMATMSYDHTDKRATAEAFTAQAANTRSFASGASVNTNYTMAQRKLSGDRFVPPTLGQTSKLSPVGHPTASPSRVVTEKRRDKKQTVEDFSL